MKTRTLASLAAAAALVAAPAWAHHSFAMFDLEKNVTIQGVVKEVQWANPHVWIQVLIPSPEGGQAEWGVELGTTGMLQRTGWTRSTLKPGDKVSVVIHPLRTGGRSGSLVSIDVPDGRTLGAGNTPPRPTRPG